MRKILFIVLSAISLSIVAQNKVAVYVTGEQSDIKKVLGAQLVDAFTKSGKYAAVERTASFLSELSKEQNYQRTGAVSDNDISRLGKQFGVQYVCVADVSNVFDQKFISTRLIHVESAQVVKSANASGEMKNMDDLLSLINRITSEYTGLTEQEKAIEKAQQEALKREQEQEKEIAKREQRVQYTLGNGYIIIGSLFVTYPALATEDWRSANKRMKSCKVGGFTSWRFPTETELRSIRQTLRAYGDSDFFSVEREYLKRQSYYNLRTISEECVWMEGGNRLCHTSGQDGYANTVFVIKR